MFYHIFQRTFTLPAKCFKGVSLFLRYFKVLIQEMDLKVDLGFLYAIVDLFTAENASIMSSEQEVSYYNIPWDLLGPCCT